MKDETKCYEAANIDTVIEKATEISKHIRSESPAFALAVAEAKHRFDEVLVDAGNAWWETDLGAFAALDKSMTVAYRQILGDRVTDLSRDLGMLDLGNDFGALVSP